MEVASPLTTLGPSPAGNKRGCSPSADEECRKRRRFYTAAEMDSLSEDFSSQSLFKSQAPKGVFATNGASSFIKRVRIAAAESTVVDHSNKHEELERVIQEQARRIEALSAQKASLETNVRSLQSETERLSKDNGILRKAVTIQEERRVAAEQEARQFQEQTAERVQALEQVIRTLRYHLQVANVGHNDFMQPRPPDVF